MTAGEAPGSTPAQETLPPPRWRDADGVEVLAVQLTPANLDALWQRLESKPHYGNGLKVDGLSVYNETGREVALFGEWIVMDPDDGLPWTASDAEFRERFKPYDARTAQATATPGQATLPPLPPKWADDATAIAAFATNIGLSDANSTEARAQWQALSPHRREQWRKTAQAVVDAATEGSLRACGYTPARETARGNTAAAGQARVTPGQAARERLLAAQLKRDTDINPTPWDELPQDYRDDWEDIARAAIAAQQPQAAPTECPDCGSPQPSMHPAVSGGGEVTRLCGNPFHSGELTASAREHWAAAVPGQASQDTPRAAPELAAAMRETREIRNCYADLCNEFGDSPQSGQSARISLTVLNRHREAAGLKRRKPAPAGERKDAYMTLYTEREALRELLDEIGGMAANAPEDGDSFAVLEQIAMRAASSGIPDDKPPAARVTEAKGDQP